MSGARCSPIDRRRDQRALRARVHDCSRARRSATPQNWPCGPVLLARQRAEVSYTVWRKRVTFSFERRRSEGTRAQRAGEDPSARARSRCDRLGDPLGGEARMCPATDLRRQHPHGARGWLSRTKVDIGCSRDNQEREPASAAAKSAQLAERRLRGPDFRVLGFRLVWRGGRATPRKDRPR